MALLQAQPLARIGPRLQGNALGESDGESTGTFLAGRALQLAMRILRNEGGAAGVPRQAFISGR